MNFNQLERLYKNTTPTHPYISACTCHCICVCVCEWKECATKPVVHCTYLFTFNVLQTICHDIFHTICNSNNNDCATVNSQYIAVACNFLAATTWQQDLAKQMRKIAMCAKEWAKEREKENGTK